MTDVIREAMRESAARNVIVHLEAEDLDAEDLAFLHAESADSANYSSASIDFETQEFWGGDDNSDWRIHVLRVAVSS